MLFKQGLMLVIFAFFFLGLMDRFFGNRLGFGPEFTRAMGLMGQIALSIVGMICLAPVLAGWLKPLVVPFYQWMGADPAMFAPNFIAVDSGGYAMAVELADDPMTGRWAGACVASLLGGSISFNIPVMFGLISRENYRVFSLGALSGLMCAPLGCFLGGLCWGLGPVKMLRDLLPVIVVAVGIALGLLLLPNIAIRCFVFFSRGLSLLIALALAAAVLERLTGIVVIPGMRPLGDGLLIAGTVTITCAGTMCMIWLLTRIGKGPLERASCALGIDRAAAVDILIAMATIVPGGNDYEKMNRRGQLIYGAVVCTAANILGAHMGYLGVEDPALLPAMLVSKLAAGCAAVPLVLFFGRRLAE